MRMGQTFMMVFMCRVAILYCSAFRYSSRQAFSHTVLASTYEHLLDKIQLENASGVIRD